MLTIVIDSQDSGHCIHIYLYFRHIFCACDWYERVELMPDNATDVGKEPLTANGATLL